MKKISLVVFCILSFVLVKAQAPCAVFYTELGERFTIYIDGIAQHQYAESNVKILDISGLNHNVRITFENGFIEDVNKSISLANGTESSFMIHKKQGRYDMSPKNQIPLTQASRSANTNVQAVVNFRGNNNVTTTTTTSDGGNTNVGINMGVSGDGGNVNMNISVSDNSGNSSNGTVTTSVGVSTSGGGKKDVAAGHAKDGGSGRSDVVVSSSGGGKKDVAAGHAKDGKGGRSDVVVSTSGGVKTSVSASGNTSNNTKPTTTTTNVNISGNINPANNVQLKPVVAGYNGRIGCPNPMTAEAFAQAKESVQSKSFSSAQLTIAKQIVDANCLLVSQVKEILKIFDFEESKLEFAKYAYKHTCDLDNYYQVNDAFDFEGSVTKLDEYIKTIK